MTLRGKRIFIVEDDPANLSITLTYLRQAGAIVKFERWNFSGVNQIKDFLPIHLILLDIGLKKVSGESVFDNIKSIPELKEIPIVALTASDSNTMIRLREKGFSGFIGKPINPSFPGLIEKILNGESIWLASSE